jgi:hypothetical protein
MPADRCQEPHPDSPQGGLIGQIGGHIFRVGRQATIVAEESGDLFLRINDLGLFDNDGVLSVVIGGG